MANYSTASDNAQDALENAAGGIVKYEIRTNGRTVERVNPSNALETAAKLEGLQLRRSGRPIFSLAKFKSPQ